MPELTDDELADQGSYLTAYYGAVEILTREQEYWCGIAKGMAGTQSDRAMAAATGAGIGQKLLALESKHGAIMDRYDSGVKPPSAAAVKKSIQLTEKLAKDIRVQVVASKVLGVVAAFVEAWSKL